MQECEDDDTGRNFKQEHIFNMKKRSLPLLKNVQTTRGTYLNNNKHDGHSQFDPSAILSFESIKNTKLKM